MPDIDLLLRTQLLRISPQLQLSDVNALIHECAGSCIEIHDDDQWHRQTDPPPSYAFCHICDVGLAAILRQSELDLFAFATDEALVRKLENELDRVEVFEQLVRLRSVSHETRLTLKLPEALSWMERHSESNEAV